MGLGKAFKEYSTFMLGLVIYTDLRIKRNGLPP